MTNKRQYKGKNLLTLLDDYTVVDIETSNNGRIYGEIVELSAIKVRNNEVVSTFDTLLKPSQPIDPWTQQIHHITNKMVLDAPRIEEVYPQFLDFVGDDLLIGHNVHFDINFIYDYHQELNQPPLKNDFLDTLRLSRRVLKKLPSYSLSNLSVHFGLEPTTHRALGDCLNTHIIYQIIKSQLTEEEKAFLATVTTKTSTTRHSVEHLIATTDQYTQDNFFYKKNVVFTGKITNMTRKQAAQLVVNARGKVFNDLDSNTNILVVGDVDYQIQRFGKFSQKHLHALALQKENHPILIMNQDDFLEIISLDLLL